MTHAILAEKTEIGCRPIPNGDNRLRIRRQCQIEDGATMTRRYISVAAVVGLIALGVGLWALYSHWHDARQAEQAEAQRNTVTLHIITPEGSSTEIAIDMRKSEDELVPLVKAAMANLRSHRAPAPDDQIVAKLTSDGEAGSTTFYLMRGPQSGYCFGPSPERKAARDIYPSLDAAETAFVMSLVPTWRHIIEAKFQASRIRI